MVAGLPPIEQNYQYLGFGSLTGGRRVGGSYPVGPPQPVERAGGTEARIAAIDGEVTPTYAQNDSTYTTGLGHSVHTKMLIG